MVVSMFLSHCWSALLDFIYPPRCPLCGAYVEERGGWCPGCLREAAVAGRLVLAEDSPVRAAWAAGLYRGGLRELIRGLKYHGKKANLPYIRTVLDTLPAEFLGGAEAAFIDLAVPVPLHPERERQRGFNQAAHAGDKTAVRPRPSAAPEEPAGGFCPGRFGGGRIGRFSRTPRIPRISRAS